MTLNSPINIPLRVDATYSDGTGTVTPPATDFSLLHNTIPTSGGNMSNTQPWLGDTSRSETANDYTLPQGVHLHWTLPKSLRHGVTVYLLDNQVYNELIQQGVPWSLVQALKKVAGTQNEYTLDQLNVLLNGLVASQQCPGIPTLQKQYQTIPKINSDDPNINVYSYLTTFGWDPVLLQIYGPMVVKYAARMKMLPAPNRWLIIRSDSKQHYTSWVLESDRLSYPQINPQPSGSGTWLNNPVVINRFSDTSAAKAQNTGSIYEYLGASFNAKSWKEDPSANRLAPFTCLGNGSLEFAGTYTNCYGVFGYCDASVVDDSANYTYTIVGWYSDPSDDPASSSFKALPWSSQNTTPAEMLSTLQWSAADTDLSKIDGSIYTATINVTGSNCSVNGELPSLSKANVSIGNSATEALSAFICQSQTSASSSTSSTLGLAAETLLNAAQTGQAQKTLEADGTALIENSLHQSGFQSGTHGWQWQIKPLPKEQQPSKPAALPQNTANDLSVLNERQRQFDRTQNYLLGERLNLFNDWCRALHLETDESGLELQTKSGDILNQSSLSIDAAGMGYAPTSTPESFLSYQALCDLYDALKTILSDLANTEYTLKKIPAPRYFKPNDPHIMVSEHQGESVPSPLTCSPADPLPYDKKSLVCTLASSTPPPKIPQSAQTIFGNWTGNPPANTPNIDSVFNYILNSPATQTATYSWRPLYLQWQAGLYPCKKGTGGLVPGNNPSFTNYSDTFLTDNFKLDSNGLDYVNKPATQFSQPSCTYNGRVILTSNTVQTMKSQILQLCGLSPNDPPSTITASDLPGLLGSDTEAAQLITSAYAQDANTLSQALDGFSARLLMLRNIHQVSVFDPNGTTGLINNNNGEWDSDSQSNYVEIGLQHAYSPQQTDAYNPVRAGKSEITSINLIDAFGQKITWSLDSDNLFVSNSLVDMTDRKVEDSAPAFLLPPRFAQESRVMFRWITANSTVESNNLAESSPVCGWVALNRVDNTILFFNADGTAYGFIDPGTGSFTPLDAAEHSSNTFLDQIVIQISNTAAATQFFDDIDNTLLTIEPFSHQSTNARSVLISRPLAIAQASIKLELLGAPSGHQGFEWLQTLTPDTDGNVPTDEYSPVAGTSSPFIKRETCGFTGIEVPVYLGDVSMANDGLLLYWGISTTATGPCIASDYTLVSNQGGAENSLPITADPADPGKHVLMLLDPRAPVHITTAVLPVKQITIPPSFYTEALRSMEYQMSVAPLVTAYNPNNDITLPIPKEITGKWVWKATQKSKTSLALIQSDDKVHLQDKPPSIQTGILQFNRIEEGKS